MPWKKEILDTEIGKMVLWTNTDPAKLDDIRRYVVPHDHDWQGRRDEHGRIWFMMPECYLIPDGKGGWREP